MTTMAKAFLILVVALVAVPSAAAWRSNTFQSPTTNIVCRYRPYSHVMRCMTRNDGFTVVLRGWHAYVGRDYSVSIPTGSPVLRYGQSWESNDGDVLCVSRITGMTCRITYGRHGFFISRRTYRVW
jgi:hypothetical protein